MIFLKNQVIYFVKLFLSFAILICLLTPIVIADSIPVIEPVMGPIKYEKNADDSAIWVHPTNKSKSLWFFSDKDKGFMVTDVNGDKLQTIQLTTLNNIDVRSNFHLGSQKIPIVIANLRDISKFGVYKINPNWDSNNLPLTELAGPDSSDNDSSKDSYGFTLYQRLSDDNIYIFDKSKGSAKIKQWLVDGSDGKVKIKLVREVNTDVSIGVAEGFVADDQLGYVYFAEESGKVHKYYADPDNPIKTRVSVFGQGEVKADLEGMAGYYCNDGSGYIIGSSQGDSTFVVWDRVTNQLVKKFKANKCSGTDGLDVTSSTTSNLTQGYVIIHDDKSMTYYVYRWEDVAGSDLKVCPDGGSGGTLYPTTAVSPTSIIPTQVNPTQIISSLACDCIENNCCDVYDFNLVAAHFGRTGVGSDEKADLNNDGKVDINDYQIVVNQFGQCVNVTITPIPPTSSTLPTSGPTIVPESDFTSFGIVEVEANAFIKGQGTNIDSIGFWRANNINDSLMLVTSKGKNLTDVFKAPWTSNDTFVKALSNCNGGKNNGIWPDQSRNEIHISVADPANQVCVFSLPSLDFNRSYNNGGQAFKSEPNITLGHMSNTSYAYVSADNIIYIYNAITGDYIKSFNPGVPLETLAFDDKEKILYVVDEKNHSGLRAFNWDGIPYNKNGSNAFGNDTIQGDGEGMTIRQCNDGRGLIIVSDQKNPTDFEFFSANSWKHLGKINIKNVNDTDGVTVSHFGINDFPKGVLAAIDDDSSVVIVDWDKIEKATGLICNL